MTDTTLTIAGASFDLEDQKFIIQAMIYFDYPAASVAPCLGLCEDGSVVNTAEQVEAAKQFFENHWGLVGNLNLWERNDGKFKSLVDLNVRRAREDQRFRLERALEKR